MLKLGSVHRTHVTRLARLLVPALASLSLGCTSYALLELPTEHDPGGSSTYVCPQASVAGDGTITGPCVADTTVDDARFNQASTSHYLLPECPNGIRRILSGGGQILVECAAPSGGDDDVGFPTSGAEAPAAPEEG